MSGSYPPEADVGSSPAPATKEALEKSGAFFIYTYNPGLCTLFMFCIPGNMIRFTSAIQRMLNKDFSHTMSWEKKAGLFDTDPGK